MEAGAKKWIREGNPKGTQNLTPFGEPRCSETQGIQRVLELFGLLEGTSFGLISGAISGPIPGPPEFGTLQDSNEHFRGSKGELFVANPDLDPPSTDHALQEHVHGRAWSARAVTMHYTLHRPGGREGGPPSKP